MLLFPHTHIPDTTSSVYHVSCRQPFHLARVSPVFSVNDGQTLIRHLPADNAKRIVKRAVSSLSLMKLPESWVDANSIGHRRYPGPLGVYIGTSLAENISDARLNEQHSCASTSFRQEKIFLGKKQHEIIVQRSKNLNSSFNERIPAEFILILNHGVFSLSIFFLTCHVILRGFVSSKYVYTNEKHPVLRHTLWTKLHILPSLTYISVFCDIAQYFNNFKYSDLFKSK